MRRNRTAFPGMVRLLCVALVLCAVVLAPVGVRLAHPPAAMAVAADLHVHGSDHLMGRVHAGDLAGGHDASDHEQQIRLHPARASADPVPGRDRVVPAGRTPAPSAIREGPRRPPRFV